jgi:hypothetical protein
MVTVRGPDVLPVESTDSAQGQPGCGHCLGLVCSSPALMVRLSHTSMSWRTVRKALESPTCRRAP